MRLMTLRLHNFKGIRDFILEPQGKDISVFGMNASGKTTLADAFWFILFGKDTSGRTDFEILPLDSDGHQLKGITESEVEAVLRIKGEAEADVRDVTLRKVFSEKWTKKRGRAEAEFSGHETAYFIDGVPQKKADYDAYIRQLLDEERFKLLTNARYFNEILDWKSRRKIILGLGAEIPDADVIAGEPGLADLAGLLGGRTVDDFRKVLDAELRKTNQELDKLPVRIDEANKNLPPTQEMDTPALPMNLQVLRMQRAEKASLLATVDTGGGIAEKMKELREVEGQITDLDNKHRQTVSKEIAEAQRILDKANSEVKRLETEAWAFDKEVALALGDIKNYQEAVDFQVTLWNQATDMTFAYSDSRICPVCQQALPDDQVIKAREKAQADFNREKSQAIERIERDGKQAQEQLKTAQGNHVKASYSKEQAGKGLQIVKANQGDFLKKLEAVEAKQSQPSSDPLRHQLADKILGLQTEIADLRRGSVNPAKDALASEIKYLDAQIASVEHARAMSEQRTKGLDRIKELQGQQRQLGKVFEGLEYQRTLCEKFVVAKAAMVNERVNSLFTLARFRLYEVQINGGINDQMCETTLDGKPYSALSNGERLMVGMDIIETLCRFWNMTVPCFLDNREGLTFPIVSSNQLISLWVSPGDKVLRIAEGREWVAA